VSYVAGNRSSYDGRDVIDAGLEIGSENVSGVTVTATNRVSGISGTTQDATGRILVNR
jgi:hypothetical protein